MFLKLSYTFFHLIEASQESCSFISIDSSYVTSLHLPSPLYQSLLFDHCNTLQLQFFSLLCSCRINTLWHRFWLCFVYLVLNIFWNRCCSSFCLPPPIIGLANVFRCTFAIILSPVGWRSGTSRGCDDFVCVCVDISGCPGAFSNTCRIL